MTQQSRDDLKTDIVTNLEDGGLNTADEVRTELTDLADSCYNLTTDTSDDIVEGSTNLLMTASERSKLSGIEANADVTDSANVLSALVGQNLVVADIDTGNGATEINVAASKGVTGSDADAVTGTAGTAGNLLEWNADGDAVDSGHSIDQSLNTTDTVTFAQARAESFRSTSSGGAQLQSNNGTLCGTFGAGGGNNFSFPNVDINGGAIDGTVIGANSAAAITGTTGNFSGNVNVSAAFPRFILTDTDNNADHYIAGLGGTMRLYADFNDEAANSEIQFFIDSGEVASFNSAGLDVSGTGTFSGAVQTDSLNLGSMDERIISGATGQINPEMRGAFIAFTDTNGNDPSGTTAFAIRTGDTQAGGTATTLLNLTKAGDLTLEGDLSAAGISFDGGSNTMSAYEEGTFTPTYEALTGSPTITYASQEGHYIRIGNLCLFSIRLRTSAFTAAGTATVRVAGLPFVVKNTTGMQFACSIYFTNNWPSGNSPVQAAAREGDTEIILLKGASSDHRDGAGGGITEGDFGTGSGDNDLSLTGCYIIN